MATFTGNRASSTFRLPSQGYASQMHLVHGSITISAAPADGDIYQLMWTPRRFLLLGGHLSAADIDTGTEALDIDLGWAANGSSSQETITTPDGTSYADSGYAADPDGLLNAGVWSGDAITDLHAGSIIYRPIILGTPLMFVHPTLIQLEANAAAGTFTAGDVTVTLWGNILDH